MFRAPPPERRRRRDLVAVAAIVVLLAGAGLALGATGDVAGTTSRPAAVPITAPPAAVTAPAAFAPAWSAPSPGTTDPVVAGPAVVTADGTTVTGHDAVTGAESWSYTRDMPLCAVAAGFPGVDEGRVLALYANDTDLAADGGDLSSPDQGDGPYCSELTMLRADTGERESARNPDARPGARLLADGTYVMAVGDDHLEVWRSDLVRTLEYGTVPAQEQVGRQPRPGCAFGSAAVGGRRVAVVERCPGESTERLTVLAADGEDGAEEPEERFSVALPGADTTILALSEDRVALTSDGRFSVLDATGAEVTGPDPLICDDPLDDSRFVLSGTDAIALDPCALTPSWTVPGALGAPVRYGTDVLVPVPGGLLVVDDGDGTPGRVIPVERPDGPVSAAVQGQVVLELRGTELVALVPTS